MLQQYAIRHNLGRSEPTGLYYTDRNGRTKQKTTFTVYYETQAGTFRPEEWRKLIRQEINEEGLEDLLDQIRSYCRTHCPWLKKDKDLEDHAMSCLASGAYTHWEGFKNDIETTKGVRSDQP